MGTAWINLKKSKTVQTRTRITMMRRLSRTAVSKAMNKMAKRIKNHINLMKMTYNNKIQTLKVTIRIKIKTEVEMISRNNNLPVKNVLTSFVAPKKYTKNSDLKFNMQNIDFCVSHAMKIIVTKISVNSVNKFIPAVEIHKMMINGLDAINAADG